MTNWHLAKWCSVIFYTKTGIVDQLQFDLGHALIDRLWSNVQLAFALNSGINYGQKSFRVLATQSKSSKNVLGIIDGIIKAITAKIINV